MKTAEKLRLEAKRKARVESARAKARRYRFRVADLRHSQAPPDDPDLITKLEAQAELFERKAQALESPKYILADNPEAREALTLKLDRLRLLGEFGRRCNRTHRATGTLRGVILTPYWERVTQAHIEAHGRPFPERWFTQVRKRALDTRKRLAKLEARDSFRPFEVGGVPVRLVDGQIRVGLPRNLPPAWVDRLRGAPLRLRFSVYSGFWVRKHTGLGSEFFDALKRTLGAFTGSEVPPIGQGGGSL